MHFLIKINVILKIKSIYFFKVNLKSILMSFMLSFSHFKILYIKKNYCLNQQLSYGPFTIWSIDQKVNKLLGSLDEILPSQKEVRFHMGLMEGVHFSCHVIERRIHLTNLIIAVGSRLPPNSQWRMNGLPMLQ